MANIATVTFTVDVTAVLPPGAQPYDHTVLSVKDAAGNVQTANVNGTESPPWTAVFSSVAAGAGTVTAQAVDAAGSSIGTLISQDFTEVGTPPPATFPAPTAIAVAVS